MSDPRAGGGELPDDVRRLVHESVPTLEALEIMLLIARDPGREWLARDVTRLIRSPRVTDTDVDSYFALLAAHGIMRRRPSGTFVFEPSDAATTRAVEGLIVAYHQRPVTLVRTVYEGAEAGGIRSFADAFRLRRKD